MNAMMNCQFIKYLITLFIGTPIIEYLSKCIFKTINQSLIQHSLCETDLV